MRGKLGVSGIGVALVSLVAVGADCSKSDSPTGAPQAKASRKADTPATKPAGRTAKVEPRGTKPPEPPAKTGRQPPSPSPPASPSPEKAKLNAALVDAAVAGNKARVEALLAQGADINASVGTFSGTPLIEAASRGHKGVVELLIARGADVNGKGCFEGGTPLYYVAIRGQLEVALMAARTEEQFRDASVTALEETERIGKREHENRGFGGDFFLEDRGIDEAAFVRRNGLRREAADRDTRRIRPMRGVGDEDDLPEQVPA
jgi:hypothetical protein